MAWSEIKPDFYSGRLFSGIRDPVTADNLADASYALMFASAAETYPVFVEYVKKWHEDHNLKIPNIPDREALYSLAGSLLNTSGVLIMSGEEL